MMLPIKLQQEFRGQFIYGLPLCILQSRSELSSWVMTHYLRCVTFFNESGMTHMEFDDGVSYNNVRLCSDPFDMMFYSDSMLSRRDPIALIMEMLYEGYYSVVFLDTYYLEDVNSVKQKFSTHEMHRVHEILIYGTNDRGFMYVNMDEVTHKFTEYTLSYENLRQGIEAGMQLELADSVKWIRLGRIVFLKVKSVVRELELSESNCLACIDMYRRGWINPELLRFCLPDTQKYYSGPENGLFLANTLRCDKNDDRSPYPTFHAWYESKLMIMNRLHQYRDMFKGEFWEEFENRYQAVLVKTVLAQKLRVKYIASRKEGLLLRIADLLEDVYQLEIDCMSIMGDNNGKVIGL